MNCGVVGSAGDQSPPTWVLASKMVGDRPAARRYLAVHRPEGPAPSIWSAGTQMANISLGAPMTATVFLVAISACSDDYGKVQVGFGMLLCSVWCLVISGVASTCAGCASSDVGFTGSGCLLNDRAEYVTEMCGQPMPSDVLSGSMFSRVLLRLGTIFTCRLV